MRGSSGEVCRNAESCMGPHPCMGVCGATITESRELLCPLCWPRLSERVQRLVWTSWDHTPWLIPEGLRGGVERLRAARPVPGAVLVPQAHACQGLCGRQETGRVFSCSSCWLRIPRDTKIGVWEAWNAGDLDAVFAGYAEASEYFRESRATLDRTPLGGG